MLKLIHLLQNTVRVRVEYYDDEERRKLLAYPTAAEIENIVRNGVEIPTREFLTYYLFRRKRPGKPGFRNYVELGRRIGFAMAELDEWIDFNGDSISSPPDVTPQDTHITERVGESIGLSVVNRIHGLTLADWDKIPEQRGRRALPTFDYEIASDGKNIVQVETKGSCVGNNDERTATIGNHKTDIDRKKALIRTQQAAGR